MAIAVAPRAPFVDGSFSNKPPESDVPPINFLYHHLHASIRAELSKLSTEVQIIETVLRTEDVSQRLLNLRKRCRMLVQVNRYHSSVEDEIVYPALECQVQNVTHSYSFEHGEEEHLLYDLQGLLEHAISLDDLSRNEAIHELRCKVEEVHVTLEQHLRKEEDQLLPLLLQYFSFREQADLVVQFICCIPVKFAINILEWLCSSLTEGEMISLRQHIASVTSDISLQRLVLHWLQPVHRAQNFDIWDQFPVDSLRNELEQQPGTAPDEGGYSANNLWAGPLRTMILLRQGLMEAVETLTNELRSMAVMKRASTAQFHRVSQQWQSLCTVSSFHGMTDDNTVLPIAHAFSSKEVAQDHAREKSKEAAALSRTGRLLKDWESGFRRNAENASGLLKQLVLSADDVKTVMKANLVREETEIIPALQHHLTRSQQFTIVWILLQALPLRLLERIMPWVALQIGPQGLTELMKNYPLGDDATCDEHLLKLLSMWSQRGFNASVHVHSCSDSTVHRVCGGCQESDVGEVDPAKAQVPLSAPVHYLSFKISTCKPSLVQLNSGPHQGEEGPLVRTSVTPIKQDIAGLGDCGHIDQGSKCGLTQNRTMGPTISGNSEIAEVSADEDASACTQSTPEHSPIDHIFQFHRALRREMNQIQDHARSLQAIVADPQGLIEMFELELKRLSARFFFVQSIYYAHSLSEDEVVFPALEAKQELRNVSKSYVLDHVHESELFAQLQTSIIEIQEVVKQNALCESNNSAIRKELVDLSGKLHLKCASMRASIETHVHAEEYQIWPLFSEHFPVEEQRELVGTIIGRTGAVVLQALIPWVIDSFSEHETDAMMQSLRSAAQNTHFDRWLDSIVPCGPGCPACKHSNAQEKSPDDDNGVSGAYAHSDKSSQSCGKKPPDDTCLHRDRKRRKVCRALGNRQDATPPGCSDLASATEVYDSSHLRSLPALQQWSVESSEYQAGWSDIFRMNAAALETAAANATPDNKHREKYLARHIMASRFVVAQQVMQEMVSPLMADVSPTTTSSRHVSTCTIKRCPHYQSKCNLIAPCCGKEVACRLCHDEQLVCMKDMDRYKVTEMVCRECGTRQPCAQYCINCKQMMARYFCSICNLFDDTPGRDIYHCPFCNMCRRGKGLGIDVFHCMRCNTCMSLELWNNHKCRQNAMQSNCPICHEDLFESCQPVKELPCGHFMHTSCFARYTQYRYTCPICFKSVGDMTLYFQMLDRLVSNDVMPSELSNLTQNIQCNDCGGKCTVKYHFVYHKCTLCGSYNTRLV